MIFLKYAKEPETRRHSDAGATHTDYATLSLSLSPRGILTSPCKNARESQFIPRFIVYTKSRSGRYVRFLIGVCQ